MANDIFDTLFDKSTGSLPDIDDMENVFSLNIDDINASSCQTASNKINNLLRLYNDKEFTDNNPEFKKRVDTEIDNLRRLYKLVETNETIHDNLAKTISQNPNNASLYTALARLQSNMIDIQRQINANMKEFTLMCKAYQTEMNFNADNNSNHDSDITDSTTANDGGIISRGRKAFNTAIANEEAIENSNTENQ